MAFSRLHLLFGALLLGAGRAKPLTLNIFYETNCPFTQRYLLNQVLPLWNDPAWKPLVTFHWVAYGMAQPAGAGVACQHGDDECVGNRVQICAQNQLGMDSDQTTDFVLCMEKNAANGQACSFQATYEACSPQLAAQFHACAQAPASLAELQKRGVETQGVVVTQVPWVVLPEAMSYNLAGSDLKATLCTELTSRNIAPPASCAAVAPARRLRAAGGAGGANVTLV